MWVLYVLKRDVLWRCPVLMYHRYCFWFQATTPLELPIVAPKPKQDSSLIGQFKPPPPQQGPTGSLGVSCPVRPVLGTTGGAVPSRDKSTPPADDPDHELDLLLTLQTSGPDQSQSTDTPEDEMEVPDTRAYSQSYLH